MKKYAIIALVFAVGVTFAHAASLKVPWFVDEGGPNIGVPPKPSQFTLNSDFETSMGVVTLSSNRTDELLVEIEYFDQTGTSVGPAPENDNTFVINPLSSLIFRPGTFDPANEPEVIPVIGPDPTAPDGDGEEQGNADSIIFPLGQEGSQGMFVPDRPRGVDQEEQDLRASWGAPQVAPLPQGASDKGNGSLRLSWEGDPTDLQGQVLLYNINVRNGDTVTTSYAHLLPPGPEN